MMIAALTAGEYAFLMTTLGGVVVSIIMAWRNSVKAEQTAAKTDVIAAHVNSAATAANAKIAELQNEITALKSERAYQRQTAALKAQADATTKPELTPDSPPVSVIVENESNQPVPTETIKPPKQ